MNKFMRRGPSVLLVALLAACDQEDAEGDTQGDTLLDRAEPQLHVGVAELDFGEVLVGERKRAAVSITNQGTSDLSLYRVRSSCSCAVTQITRGADTSQGTSVAGIVLAPAEVAVLDVMLVGPSRLGALHQRITLETSDPVWQAYQLPIHAHVTQAVHPEPGYVSFSPAFRGVAAEQTITLRVIPTSHQGIEVKTPFPFIETRLIPQLTSHSDSYTLVVYLLSEAPCGLHRGSLEIALSGLSVPPTIVPLVAKVEPPVSFEHANGSSCSSIEFGILRPGTEYSREILIRSLNPGAPYVIDEVSVECSQRGHVTVTLDRTAESPSEYRVCLTIQRTIQGRFFKGDLILRSNWAELREKRLPFSGWILADGQDTSEPRTQHWSRRTP